MYDTVPFQLGDNSTTDISVPFNHKKGNTRWETPSGGQISCSDKRSNLPPVLRCPLIAAIAQPRSALCATPHQTPSNHDPFTRSCPKQSRAVPCGAPRASTRLSMPSTHPSSPSAAARSHQRSSSLSQSPRPRRTSSSAASAEPPARMATPRTSHGLGARAAASGSTMSAWA